jgi:bacteriocin-processing peptidase. Cysteine peptidase. MEROPS family C39
MNRRSTTKLRLKPEVSALKIERLDFGYFSGEDEKILKQINLDIPAGKVTAIVGMSGSGKTTLLKDSAKIL